MTELVKPGASLERVASGFGFVEGPVWHPESQSLFFSDLDADMRRCWRSDVGATIVRQPNNKGNGLTYDAQLNLIVCEHTTSSVVRENSCDRREVLAARFDGRELNSPNDVVVAASGAIYFTDPIFGRTAEFGVRRPQQLEHRGVYRIANSGMLELVADGCAQPNGLCFSPDERRLYVTDTARAHIRVFGVTAEGSLTDKGCLAERIGTGRLSTGVVDGIKCDEQGNVYAAGPGGIWVFSDTGVQLGRIDVPEPVANMNWGGDDWRVLWIAASTSIYRLSMSVRGAWCSYMGESGHA